MSLLYKEICQISCFQTSLHSFCPRKRIGWYNRLWKTCRLLDYFQDFFLDFGFCFCTSTVTCWYKNWKSGFAPVRDHVRLCWYKNRNPETRNPEDDTFSAIGCICLSWILLWRGRKTTHPRGINSDRMTSPALSHLTYIPPPNLSVCVSTSMVTRKESMFDLSSTSRYSLTTLPDLFNDPINRERKHTKPLQTEGPGMDLPPNRLQRTCWGKRPSSCGRHYMFRR